jgi:hypothetical protein
MNTSTTDLNDGGFDSRDCVILIVDGPGDNTVRPPSPEFLKWAEAERERLAKYGFNLDGTRIEQPDGPETK